MQIVIELDEDVYARLFDKGIQDNEIATDDICEMARSLRLGTPLPEHHGRLIDADYVINHICESKECYKENCKGKLYMRCMDIMWVDDASTIIDEQEPYTKILDKITAEIMQLDYDLENVDYDYNDMPQTEEVHMICREEVLQIIDEYKVESEE